MQKENVVLTKSYNFALRIVEMSQYLTSEKREFVLSKQILNSGTSIEANVEEAIGGISKANFKAKMSIAYKDARETDYWLRVFHDTGYVETKIFNSIKKDCDELLKIIYTIIKSTGKSINN